MKSITHNFTFVAYYKTLKVMAVAFKINYLNWSILMTVLLSIFPNKVK